MGSVADTALGVKSYSVSIDLTRWKASPILSLASNYYREEATMKTLLIVTAHNLDTDEAEWFVCSCCGAHDDALYWARKWGSRGPRWVSFIRECSAPVWDSADHPLECAGA